MKRFGPVSDEAGQFFGGDYDNNLIFSDPSSSQ